VGGVLRFNAALAGGGGSGREKPCGTDQAGTGRGGVGIDGSAPGIGVGAGDERGGGDVVVIRIAEVVGAVHVGAAVGFGDQMKPLRGAVAEFGEIIAGEDVEGADKHDAARRWRRGADDGVVVKCGGDRLALNHGILGQIV
jgi:hypothetical protein